MEADPVRRAGPESVRLIVELSASGIGFVSWSSSDAPVLVLNCHALVLFLRSLCLM
jgi:hypothetical protein